MGHILDPDKDTEAFDEIKELASLETSDPPDISNLMKSTIYGPWCLYDIPNEHVMYCDENFYPDEDMMKANIIRMPIYQAHLIRRTKGLPMPAPPVKVRVHEGYGTPLDAKIKGNRKNG